MEHRFCQPPVPGIDWALLDRLIALLVGLGSIGAPLARNLLGLGVRRFVLTDPKRYGESSVGTQCAPGELGRYKVDVVAEHLRAGGAEVTACPTFVERIEPGLAGPDSFLVTSGDRLSATRAAHDVAHEMRIPFFKAQLEPSLLVASMTHYDYSREHPGSCLLCGWSSEEFQDQATAHSCAPDSGRSTRSPRALSELTAGWAALTIASALGSPSISASLHGKDLLFTPLGPTLSRTEIPVNPDCPVEHDAPGPPMRLDASPARLSLQRLEEIGEFSGSERLWVRGSGRIVLESCCAACGGLQRGCWWLLDPERAAGRCPCGGDLIATFPGTRTSVERAELRECWGEPLAALGVEQKGVIRLEGDERRVTFVIG